MDTDEFAGAIWHKSARSGNTGNCVEVAVTRDAVGVRDSKTPDGGLLAFTPDAWRAFVRGIRNGEFDV